MKVLRDAKNNRKLYNLGYDAKQHKVYIIATTRWAIPLHWVKCRFFNTQHVNYDLLVGGRGDKEKIAKAKLKLINRYKLVWYYERDGFIAAYLDARTKCHVVLLR